MLKEKIEEFKVKNDEFEREINDTKEDCTKNSEFSIKEIIVFKSEILNLKEMNLDVGNQNVDLKQEKMKIHEENTSLKTQKTQLESQIQDLTTTQSELVLIKKYLVKEIELMSKPPFSTHEFETNFYKKYFYNNSENPNSSRNTDQKLDRFSFNYNEFNTVNDTHSPGKFIDFSNPNNRIFSSSINGNYNEKYYENSNITNSFKKSKDYQ